ncbi:15616_t:CDS:2, partial [Gigaspora margarita]
KKTRNSSLDNREEGFLRVATHNINGLKMHKHKLEIFANWASVKLEVIEDAIIKVEKKVLPFKDFKNELEKQNPKLKECRDLKAIKLLSILITKIQISSVQSKTVENWIDEALTW